MLVRHRFSRKVVLSLGKQQGFCKNDSVQISIKNLKGKRWLYLCAFAFPSVDFWLEVSCNWTARAAALVLGVVVGRV